MSNYNLRDIKLGLVSKPEKPKKQIPTRSEKRIAEQKEYLKIVKDMLKENPMCELKLPGCTGKANGMHHVQKRGVKNFTKRENLKRACSHCNLWVELNSKVALDRGLTISRFKKAV